MVQIKMTLIWTWVIPKLNWNPAKNQSFDQNKIAQEGAYSVIFFSIQQWNSDNFEGVTHSALRINELAMREHVLFHPRSLISAFVVRCLDSIISLDSTAEISRT